MIEKINTILGKKDKSAFFNIFLFSIFISFVETAGVSLIMPFMSVAGDFSLISSNKYYSYIYNFLSIDNEINFVILFGIFLVFYYIFRGLINLLYTYKRSQFSEGSFYSISLRLFEKYNDMRYKDFITKNTSALTKVLVTETYNFTHVLSSVLLIISEVIIVVVLYGLMLWVDWKVTLVFTLLIAIKSLFLTKVLSKKIKSLGNEREDQHKNYYEVINTTFRNFKYIKLLENKKAVINSFDKYGLGYVKTNILGATLTQVPKIVLEMIGFSMIIVLVTYIIYKEESNISQYLPMITMYILALYRLLPSINRIMNSYNNILFYNKTTNIIYDEIISKVESKSTQKINFSKNINLENVAFSYVDNKEVLKDINISISKGDKIAFIGESGSGKTTLVDTIIGLFNPTNGNIFIDDVKLNGDNLSSWRDHIGYIPQNVYLFEGTVAQNVVFGREYDEKKLIDVLKKANIYEFLLTKEGIDTFVGDSGVMLSGGQQQRIAIARALYANPDVLVLDEATSALDNETEKNIMEEIYDISEDKTLIIIAHRLSTIKNCNKIYEIVNGRIVL